MVSGKASSVSDRCEDEKELWLPSASSAELEKYRKANEDLKRRMEKNERQKEMMIEEIRSCVKHFYPISWRSSESLLHRNIESWDYVTFSRNSKVLHKCLKYF